MLTDNPVRLTGSASAALKARRHSSNKGDCTLNVEARIAAIEDRLSEVEAEVKANRPKFDHLMQAIVDMHDDLRRVYAELGRLRTDLPTIIAESVAPLIRPRE